MNQNGRLKVRLVAASFPPPCAGERAKFFRRVGRTVDTERSGHVHRLAFPDIVETISGAEAAMSTLQASAQAQLRQFVEQIERLEEEKKAIAADIRDKFAEAKGVGFDVKALRKILQLRKKTAVERQEEEGVLEVYMHALGMLSVLVDDDAAGGYVEAAE